METHGIALDDILKYYQFVMIFRCFAIFVVSTVILCLWAKRALLRRGRFIFLSKFLIDFGTFTGFITMASCL